MLAYAVFVSHSFKDADIIGEMELSFRGSDIKLYLAEVDRQYGKSLPTKIMKAISESDAVLVIVTKEAGDSASVNQEVGYALGVKKLVVPMIERGARPGVLLQGLEWVEFSIDRLQDVRIKVGEYFANLAKKKQSSKVKTVLAVAGIMLAAVALIGLAAYEAARRK